MVAPTLTEALGQLAALQTQVAALTARVAAVEATATSNKTRLDALDSFKTKHSAGAANRQRDVDRLQAENQRLAWALKTGRRP